MKRKKPAFYKWSGGSLRNKWSFGYLTGSDHDLICIKPNIGDKMEAEVALSPVCTTRLLAISAFAFKRILLRLDDNMTATKSFCGNPNKGFDNR